MGQKTNPNILRLGKLKEWKSKYIEKKNTESSVVIFRDLEIRKFVFQLFANNGIKIQNCKTCYSGDSLYIYICYYNSTKPAMLTGKVKMQPTKLTSKLYKKKISGVRKATAKKQFYLTKTYQKVFKRHLRKESFMDPYFFDQKSQRLNAVKHFQSYTDGRNNETLNKQHKNLFISKILKGLSLFTDNKHNIFLNLKQLNKETILLQKIEKKNKHKIGKNLTKLRRFQQNEFFKKGFNLLYSFIISQQGPTFLAEFIALFLKKLKRPIFFLRFLKLALKILIPEKFSQFERIQIKVKGRFNGAPRSTHKFLNIGKNIPVLTLNSKIDYGESTAYTSNGTFGVKVWTYATIVKTHHV